LAGVRQAVALVRDSALLAYVLPQAGESLEAGALRAQLQQQLPAYLVPNVVTFLDHWPLTPNGKLDRAALPNPSRPVPSAQDQEPFTPAEQMLASLWRSLLGLDSVHRSDNFFALGGDSIISIQVVARAQQAGWRLTARDLFQHQTLAELARVAQPLASSAPASSADQGPGPLPFTPIQHWFWSEPRRYPHHYNQAVVLSLSQPLDPPALAAAADALLAHHEILRLRSHPSHQFIAADEPAHIASTLDLRALPADRQSAALAGAAQQLQGSLDLSQGPVLRLAGFQLSSGDRLLIVVHHLAIDGVSWRILLADLERAYTGSPLGLPPPSYRLWANALLAEARRPERQAELPYWHFHALSPVPALPRDREASAEDNTVGSQHSFRQSFTPAQTQA